MQICKKFWTLLGTVLKKIRAKTRDNATTNVRDWFIAVISVIGRELKFCNQAKETRKSVKKNKLLQTKKHYNCSWQTLNLFSKTVNEQIFSVLKKNQNANQSIYVKFQFLLLIFYYYHKRNSLIEILWNE